MKKTLTALSVLAFASASENAFLADDELVAKRPLDLTFSHLFADDELVKRKIMDPITFDDELLVRDPRDSLHLLSDDELTLKYPHYQRRPAPKAADNSLYRFGGNLVQNWHYPLKPMNTYVPPAQNKAEEKSAPVESGDDVSDRFGGNLVKNWHYPLPPTNTYVPAKKAEEKSAPVDEDVSSRVGGNLVKNWHYPLPPINAYVPVVNKPKVEEETLENALFTLRDMVREAGKKDQGTRKRRNINKSIFNPFSSDVKRERQVV